MSLISVVLRAIKGSPLTNTEGDANWSALVAGVDAASCDWAGPEPLVTVPFMTWADTVNDRRKMRNAANSAWIDIGGLINLTPTEALAGLPKVASQALVNAGLDDSAMVTSKKLAATFANGRVDTNDTHLVKLPGGYVLVMGTSVTTTNAVGGGAVNYPITFATTPRTVIILGDNGYRGGVTLVGDQLSGGAFGFQLETNAAQAVRVNYFAMGMPA